MGVDNAKTMEVAPFRSLVIGITGRPGVGSTHFAHRASETPPTELDPRLEHYRHIAPVYMRMLLSWQGYRPPQDVDDEHPLSMREFHYQQRRAGNSAQIIDRLEIVEDQIILVEKIRHPGDAIHIMRRGGYLMSLEASEAICDGRNNIEDSGYQEAKLEVDSPDNDPHQSDILTCMAMATVRVNFEMPLEQSTELGLAAIRNIALHRDGLEELAPTWEEITA